MYYQPLKALKVSEVKIIGANVCGTINEAVYRTGKCRNLEYG